mgnify:CR=1 FL=1
MDTLFVIGFQTQTQTVAELRKRPIFAQLPAFEKNQAYDLPYGAQRGNYDDAMELLTIAEQTFAKDK